MNKLSNYTRLIGVLLVGVIALILQFALNLPMYAQIVISTLGSRSLYSCSLTWSKHCGPENLVLTYWQSLR